jgi:aminoglycoside phosphotransferase family enzyme/predicted kinase
VPSKSRAGSAVEVARQRELFRAWLTRRTDDAHLRFAETHVSILGMSADRVWKLKKAVRFPFVDLSTPELRRANAERELRLNRRFAPDVYLGIEPVTDEQGVQREVVLAMRRMPEDRRLAVVASGSPEIARSCIDRIIDGLVAIHRVAPRGFEIDATGRRDRVLDLWDRNLAEMRPFVPEVLDTAQFDQVTADAHSYLAGREPLFSRRIADRRICDGHGDLLADDVFCLDDGPRFLDCLEFDDQLRYGDVLADVAFLTMDLERLGHPLLAGRLLDRYRVASPDTWPESLADLYVAYRAVVRAKVACLGIDRGGDDARRTARTLLALAADHLARGRVRLVLIGGPPASGKTTLARGLAARTGWTVIRSDEVRKQLAGLEPTTSAVTDLDAGLYAPDWNWRTYDALLDTARARLAGGESVILDASWSDVTRRADALRLAQTTTATPTSLMLSVPDDLARTRARERELGHDASDATSMLTAALRTRFAPWPDAIALDGTEPPAVLAANVLDAVGYPR